MTIPAQADASASLRYLLLADISGYTAFLNGVEEAHGVDFSAGLPAGYEVLGALLDAVVDVRDDRQVAQVAAHGEMSASGAHGVSILAQGCQVAATGPNPLPR
jgi:hypothetical protein